jgi:hypothetical protein
MTRPDPRRLVVVEEARGWLGTPYHHMGRVKGAGTDCLMMLAAVYERRGFSLRPMLRPRGDRGRMTAYHPRAGCRWGDLWRPTQPKLASRKPCFLDRFVNLFVEPK